MQTSANGTESTADLYTFMPTPLLVVISGPSGVGKDTLLQRLRERGHDYAFVVTMTTRPRRPNEVDGRDYFFVTHEQFDALIRADELLEHSLVYGDYKGIPKDQVRRALASGKDVLMRIDVQGAEKIRRIVPNAITIFIAPASEEELIRRLIARKTETADGLARRIATARDEMKRLCEFKYVVQNRDNQVDAAVDQVVAIITAEHCRVGSSPVTL